MNFNLYISSTDKISGTNNNGVYQVNFNDFLDHKYDKYKINFTLNTVSSNYINSANNSYSSCSVNLNTNTRFYSFSTTTKSHASTIGFLTKSADSTFLYNKPMDNLDTIIQRPSSNSLTLSFLNLENNALLVATDASGNPLGDMSNFNALFTFIPIVDQFGEI